MQQIVPDKGPLLKTSNLILSFRKRVGLLMLFSTTCIDRIFKFHMSMDESELRFVKWSIKKAIPSVQTCTRLRCEILLQHLILSDASAE